jgi:hypothetical protein
LPHQSSLQQPYRRCLTEEFGEEFSHRSDP